MEDKQLPNIPIKIVRRGEVLKLKAGKYTLELKEIPDKSQTYPLLLLDRFLTQATTNLLRAEARKQKFRQQFLGAAEEVQDNQIVNQLMKEVEDDKNET